MKHPILQKLQEDLKKELFGETKDGSCVVCKQPFTQENVFTEAGWKEVKISQMCEKCWDETFKEQE